MCICKNKRESKKKIQNDTDVFTTCEAKVGSVFVMRDTKKGIALLLSGGLLSYNPIYLAEYY